MRGTAALESPAKLGNQPPIRQLVSDLSDTIGAKLVAYVTWETQPHVIQGWINGTSVPSREAEQRLRLTSKVSKIVSDRCDKGTVQAWLQGKNPDLNEQAVVVMIRTQKDPSRLESELVSAAEQFVAQNF